MATKCGYGKVPDKIEGGDTPIQQHIHPDDRQRVLVVFFKLAQDGSFGCAPGRDPNAGNVSSFTKLDEDWKALSVAHKINPMTED